jgi:hypothetical protein
MIRYTMHEGYPPRFSLLPYLTKAGALGVLQADIRIEAPTCRRTRKIRICSLQRKNVPISCFSRCRADL